MNIEVDMPARTRSKPGEPTWEIAFLYPAQGNWTEADYLALETNHLVELNEGCLEFLPMPTLVHQLIVVFLLKAIDDHVSVHASGQVVTAPMPVWLWPEKYREPDLVYVRPERLKKLRRGQPEGADLVVEIVSEGEENRNRDLVEKVDDYARAGIQEYWIVDPERQEIKVLTLEGQAYREHGVFKPGQQAASLLLAGFQVAVAEVFKAGQKP